MESTTGVTATIEVRDLTVSRGGPPVLIGVSCRVVSGEVTGILGPSGCGKTTLMRSIVGVQVIASGEVRVLGRPAGSPEVRAEVGYVTQAPSVYLDLTVMQNARYFAAVAGVDDAAAHAAVARVGLGPYANRLVARLSGGQRSRASLACALVGSPRVLVLDEPTVGLDPVIRAELWTFFHELADAGATVLVSSHVMDEATRCDRLLLMRDGRFIADDTPDGVRARTGEEDLERAFLTLIREQEVTA